MRRGIEFSLRVLGAILLVCVLSPAAAWAAWNQPAGGRSPINQAGSRDAEEPSLTSVGGVPYLSWDEFDGTNSEVRVSRLNAAGTAWEQVVGGASPLNQANDQDAGAPSLASIGGVPYVAWEEDDGINSEVRVSRLNAAGTAWVQVVGGSSPINQASSRDASSPSLASIGGVPYVAWEEEDGTNSEVRVSRLNAAGTAWEQVVGGASPINQVDDRDARNPSLTSIGGVPYLAWVEADGTNAEVRVSRLKPAGSAWEEVVGGPSPINHASHREAFAPSLTSIGGLPYVAWSETDGSTVKVRVSRLNAAGTAWEQVVGGPSPINQAGDRDASRPSLTATGGVPYVAWSETDGTNAEVRVSRPNAAGTAWEQVVGGSTPINQAIDQDAGAPSLTSIGGVPYVAWDEDDGTNFEVRVSRLEPEFLDASETAGETEATLSAQVRTFGVAYPIAFEYGPGPSPRSETEPVRALSGNGDSAPVTQSLGGLTPSTIYSWRPVGSDGARTTATGATRVFSTGNPAGSPGSRDTLAPALSSVAISPTRFAVDPRGTVEAQAAGKSRRKPARKGTTFRYTLSEPARVTIAFARATAGRRAGKRCVKKTRKNRSRKRCVRYLKAGGFAVAGVKGKNARRFSGRISKRKLAIGAYRTTITAIDPAGNRSRSKRLSFSVVKR